MYMKKGFNKFLALLPWTEKFLGGSIRSLAYTDHIIQFGLNMFWRHWCKTRENFNFLKKGKMVILVKIRNFF